MKYLVPVLFALALAAPPAWAYGFNLTWGTGCWRDNPATLATSACDSNGGSVSFTVSFLLDASISHVRGIEAWLDLQSDSPELPDWWQLTDPGGCRQGSLSVSFEPATPSGCANAWQGRAEATPFVNWSTAAFPFYGGEAPNRAKLYVLYRSSPDNPLSSGVEYFAFTVTINLAKTVGTGACGGCSTPVTIVLNRVYLAGTGGGPSTTPLDNQCLRWQAGGVTPCSATPTRSGTWGMLKSLYR